MELWQLRTFIVVAQTLNFTRAAEELNLSQPAVSHQIKALEHKVGEKLFDRGTDGVTITNAGKAMFEHASKILDLADEMRVELHEDSEDMRGEIVMGGSFRGLDMPFHAVYYGFKQLHPNVSLSLVSEHTPDIVIQKVREGKIDLGLVPEEYDPTDLEIIPYAEYQLQFVVGRNHPLASRDKIDPSELTDLDWVLFEPTNRFRKYVDACFPASDISPKSVFETNDGTVIRALVSKGTQVSCLPSWGVASEKETGGIISVKIKGWKRKIRVKLICVKNRKSKTLRELIEFMKRTEIDGLTLLNENDGG